MNVKEYLLIKLNEEAVEIAQRADKALVFGLEEVQPEQELTTLQRLRDEVSDLFGVITMLLSVGIQVMPDMEKTTLKREKLLKFMEYSVKQGTLDSDDFQLFLGRYLENSAKVNGGMG